MKNTPLNLLLTTQVGTPRRGVQDRIADKDASARRPYLDSYNS